MQNPPRHCKFPVCLPQRKAVVFLPSLEPPTVWLEGLRPHSVQYGRMRVLSQQLLDFDSQNRPGKPRQVFFKPRLRFSSMTRFQSIANLMLAYHSYSSCRTIMALWRLPPPAARILRCAGLGARLFIRLWAATAVSPLHCSFSQLLCHSLTLSLWCIFFAAPSIFPS